VGGSLVVVHDEYFYFSKIHRLLVHGSSGLFRIGGCGAPGLRARLGKGRLHRSDPDGGETGSVGHPWAEAIDCKLASLQLIGDGASEQGAGVRKPRAPLRPHGAIKSGRNRLDLSISQVPAPRLAQFGSGG
jgi:hypothetical protein